MTEERDYAKPYLAAGAGMGGNQGYDGYRDKNARDSGISAGAGDPYDATGFSCSSEDPKVLAPGTAEGVSAPNAKGYAAAANSSIFDSTGAPRSTENDPSHGGRYNVLPSGTPSGINPDYGKTRDATARSASTSEPHREEDWAKAPAVTAVGAGLGAAAFGHYLVGQEDRSEPERKAESEGRRHSQTLGASGPAATATGSKKVVHRCQKCGEENDISSYF
ncbi:hypothetical protein GQ53DRAFT_413224 [Thozetella sp. PMI_491]|nr:hypothetical protein GQ53DRAFT_413224 [Thozetella sp. PMI_491]